MRELVWPAVCVVSLVSAVACGAEPGGSGRGIRVEARQAIQVTVEPLGDVVMGEMQAGDAATAVCFVAQARSNAGAAGAAIKITSRRFSGYAAVTDSPDDPADRVRVFDIDGSDLRAGLPACRP